MTEMKMYIESSKAFITKNKKLNKNKLKIKRSKSVGSMRMKRKKGT